MAAQGDSGSSCGGQEVDPLLLGSSRSLCQRHPLVWCLQDFVPEEQQLHAPPQQHAGTSFVRDQQQAAALKVVEQRRTLPPVLNDRALFTRAAPFGNSGDQGAYHAPSNRIGAHLSPAAAPPPPPCLKRFQRHGLLNWCCPCTTDPNAPRRRAHGSPRVGAGAPLGGSRSSRSELPLSPTSHPPACLGSGGLSATAAAAVRGSHGLQQQQNPGSLSGAGALTSPALHGLLNRGRAAQQQQRQQQPGLLGSVAAAVDDAALVDALLRYTYYVHVGMDAAHVAPFKGAWLQAALQLVPRAPPPHVCQELYDRLVSGCAEEVQADYATAVRKAILDYVLANPLERQRLGLEALAPLLAEAVGPAGLPSSSSSSKQPLGRPPQPASHAQLVQRCLPAEWRQHVAMAREGIVWGLQTLNGNVLELTRLWHDHGYASAVRLLDVASPDLLDRLPVKASWFRAHQQSAVEQARGQLWSHWLPKCLEVFRRCPPVPINNDASAYFRCVATLQGNMLRQLVAASLGDYVSFFRAHAKLQPLDVDGSGDAHWACGPVFEVDLVAQAGRVVFEPPLSETSTAVLAMLEAAVLAASGLPRISPATIAASSIAAPPAAAAAASGSVLGSAGGGGSLSVIPSTGLHEQLVLDACNELASIIADNGVGPQQLAALFCPHMALLALDPADHAARFAEGAGGAAAPDLQLFAAEVSRLRSAAADVAGLCTDSVRTGLYIVQCRGIKGQLAAAAEAAAAALLDLVCCATRDSNTRIAEAYAAMSAELGKSCESGEAVQALKASITRCTLDNEGLREAIAVNKARHEFLAAARFPVPDEDLDGARRLYERPGRFGEALREASTKAAAALRGLRSVREASAA